MQVRSKQQPLHHYTWGNDCEGWVLADTATLSVKHERMPPGSFEVLHYHQHAQQFFFILNGIAGFEVGGAMFTVKVHEGFHIPAGKKHRIFNNGEGDLEFILSSQPSANDDRINI